MKGIIILILINLICLSSCNDIFNSDDNVKIRKVVYESVQIGEQVWMKQNLDVSFYQNGDPIPNIVDSTEWANSKTGAWRYYNDDPEFGSIYGKLYNWYAVNDPRGLAPKGWKIPSDDEWKELELSIGQYLDAVNNIGFRGNTIAQKITGEYDLWEGVTLKEHSEFNITGFTGLPGGAYIENGNFTQLSKWGYWWTSTEYNSQTAYRRRIFENYLTICRYMELKDRAFSVRCIKK